MIFQNIDNSHTHFLDSKHVVLFPESGSGICGIREYSYCFWHFPGHEKSRIYSRALDPDAVDLPV